MYHHRNLSNFCRICDVPIYVLSQFLASKSKRLNAQNSVNIAHHINTFTWDQLAGVKLPVGWNEQKETSADDQTNAGDPGPVTLCANAPGASNGKED